jgi:hypothetical protein
MEPAAEPASPRRPSGRKRRRALWRVLRWLIYAVVLVPVLALVTCVVQEGVVKHGLADACAGLAPGTPLADVPASRYESRAGTALGGDAWWFDREYRRILAMEGLDEPGADGLLVLFAKPGIGYYACIVRHRDGRVRSARFVDRSS